MPAYVAFLRAVNVGGNNLLPMKRLAEIVSALGFEDVRTHLQSGNVVFTSDDDFETHIASTIEAAIEQAVGFRPKVILRSKTEIDAVFDANPLLTPATNPSRLITVFFHDQPAPDGVAKLDHAKFPEETFVVADREMYVLYGDGMARSKFNPSYYERLLGAAGTARNWNTVAKVRALLHD